MSKRFWNIFIILMLSCVMVFSSIHCKAQNVFIDISSTIIIPKHYIITKITNNIIVDGIAIESDWENAKFSDNFIDIEGEKTPKYQTKVKMLWDENYLYVYAELEEPHIWGNVTERDHIIYVNNDFEVFIDPSNNARNYGEIEINALGTEWDLFLDRAYSVGGHPIFQWNLDSLKTAVKIYGSINNPNDIDSLWTVEMAIPMGPLVGLKNAPKITPVEGEQWRINFSRVEWDFDIVNGEYKRKRQNNKLLPEYNWVWSPHKEINMHQPEKWGIVQFSENQVLQKDEFVFEEDFLFEQILYALFREIRYGQQKELLNTEVYSKLKLDVKYATNKTILAEFCKTKLGFEVEINIPDTNRYLIINEKGELRKTI